MQVTAPENTTPALSFDAPNWVAMDILSRDREQSHRLHEPERMRNSIDPITGLDIENLTSHPSLEDGILTIYFESDITRQAYLDTPFNHPYDRLPEVAAEGDDRGG